jgi:UDP-glucose 4-epimerase
MVVAILITGGTGYIGSHTSIEMMNAGYEVIIVDNFSNSRPTVLERISEITGKKITFYEADLLEKKGLEEIFSKHEIQAVVHLAGYKAVEESVKLPLLYYENNIISTLNLCEVMHQYGVRHLVFSSSAAVYGNPSKVPVTEEFPKQANNPYGRTKQVIEDILHDQVEANPNWSISLLRYFNPVGAHESGKIGEEPKGVPSNLVPFISQVAAGKLMHLNIYGNDYETEDGTGIRDYVHVTDLAKGHVKALERNMTTTGVEVYNLGTGRGYSVLEVVEAFERVIGRLIEHRIQDRRLGDVSVCFADPSKANKILNWTAEKGLEEMCRDAWRWQEYCSSEQREKQNVTSSRPITP